MFGKKNFTNTQVTGLITNPTDDILINVDNNDLTLYSKYKKGSPNLADKTVLKSVDAVNNIKLYQSASGLVDYNGYQLSANNKHLEDGLVAWYDKVIDANSGLITDKSGNGINGTLTSITNSDDGILYFDGTNDYITGSSKAIKSEGSNLSIAVWVKPDTYVDSGSLQFLVGQVNTSANATLETNKDYKLEIAADNSIYFEINSNTSNNNITGNQQLVLNEWNHIVCTYDNTTSKAYLNGVFIGSNSSVSPTLTSVYDLTIAKGSTNEDKFSGYMHDIRVYNRVIEMNEIAELYNNGAIDIKDVVADIDVVLPTANIYLKMQEGVSSNVINYGNDNTITGTLNNGAYYTYFKNKSCVYYDGSNDLLSMNKTSTTDFTGALTISMWFNIDTLQSTETVYLISKRLNYEFEIRYVYGTPNQFKFLFGNGTNNEEWILDYDINYDEWYHISVTRDIGSANIKDIKIYINGIKYNMIKASTFADNYAVSEESSTSNFTIARKKGSTTYSNMYTNNLRIYNSELNEKQIQKIYREELYDSSSFVKITETSNKLKSLTELNKPEYNSSLNDALLLNLTGQDTSTTTYVSDYSINRYNATVSTGALTYTTTDANTISATNVLSFNGSTGLSIDGTKANGIELNTINSEYSFSGWIYLSSIAANNPLYTTNKDNTLNSIYGSYIDTTGNIKLLRSDTNYDLLTYNTQFSTGTWYYITINNYTSQKPQVLYGTTSSAPTSVDLVETALSGVTYISNTYIKIANGLDTSGTPGGVFFNGKMDDIKLYSRALTQSEITTNWNSGDVNYFSSGNGNTDLIIKLDGEPGGYSSNLNAVSSTVSSVDDGLAVTYTGVGSTRYNNLWNSHPLYLKLNEGTGSTSYDYRNAYNNGTISSATWTSKNTPYNDNSLYFDGTDDYIEIANDTAHNLSGALTIACWINHETMVNDVICSKGNNYNEFFFTIGHSAFGYTDIGLHNGTGTALERWSTNFNDYANLGTWNHVAVTRSDGSTSKEVYFYINGQKFEGVFLSGDTPRVINQSTDNIFIGRHDNVSNPLSYKGYISQFRIWKYELQHSEILDIYNYSEGWNTMTKYGNFCYDLNTARKLTITTNETNTECSGELWINPSKSLQQTVLKSAYTDESTRVNGDIKLELVPSNKKELLISDFDITSGDDIILDYTENEYNDSALIVHYNMEFDISSVIDRVNSNDLTVYNTSTSDNYKNKLIDFDGTDNYCQSTTALSGFSNTSFMISVWVYTPSFGANQTIFALANGSNLFVNLVVLASTGGIRFQTRNSGGTNDNYNTTTTISANRWNHLVFVFTGGEKQVYINGFLDTTTSATGLTVDTFGSNNYITIGKFVTSTTSANIFNGYITDLKVYNNADTDIVSYNYYLKQPTNNLIACWNLFANDYQASGDTIKDYSGNGTELSEYNIGLTNKYQGLNYNNTLISFDGTDDAVSEALTSGNYFYDQLSANEDNYTVTGWINNVNGSTNIILALNTGSGTSANNRMTQLGITTTGNVAFLIRNNAQTNLVYNTTNLINSNQWYHAAFVFDINASQHRTIYVNGDEWTSTDTSNVSNLKTFPTTLYTTIGSFSSEGTSFSYEGSITDLRVYNKALSQAEIQEVMQQSMKPELSIKLGGSVTSISNNNSLINPNTWNHLAYNYNATSTTMELYMNGDLIAQNTSLTNTTAANSNIVLGDQSYEGRINNFNAYSRNLTTNEIKRSYLGFDRLKLHLAPYQQTNSTFTSDVVIYNKAKTSSPTYIHPYGSGLSVVAKDGIFSNILSFDGSTSYIDLDPESDLWRCRSFTLAMWIKPDTAGSGTNQHIFSRYLSSSYQSYYLAYDYTAQELDIVFKSGGTITTSLEVLKGVYTHIAVVFGLNNVNVYINGSYSKSINISNRLNIVIDSTLKTVIGDSSDLANKYNGYIADFRYYDTDLSADAIRAIYAGYDLNAVGTNSSITKPELEYVSTDLTTVRNKDFVQPAKSSLVLHLNNYTTGSVITSSSDNALTATATSMVSSTTEFDFDGSSSNIIVSANTDLDITGNEITISMWINPDAIPSSGTETLLLKRYNGNATNTYANDYGIYIDDNAKFNFRISGPSSPSDTQLLTSATSISASEWTHVLAIYNGTNMRVFINGVVDSNTVNETYNIANYVPGDGKPINIGSNALNGQKFNGKIRDIRIYNSALETDTIKLIYNAGLTTSGEFSIASNKKIENAGRYAYVSKYLLDAEGEPADVLGHIARDNLLVHFNGSNSSTTYSDQSVSTIPNKMISLRPNYLSSDKILSYSTNDGTLSSVGLISTGTGTINSNTVLFDGATTSNIILTGVEDKMLETWTFATWYKLTSPTSKNMFLSRKETSKNLDLFIDSSDNEIKVKYNTTTVSSNLAIDTSDYDWHHLAISKGQEGLASNIISFYHDGELVNQKRVDTALTTSATSLLIGTDNTTGFNGYMDEIRLYSSRLNDIEIGKLARGELLGGPVHYWMIEDDSTGTTVRDAGSAGNNLCLQGSGATFDTTAANVKHGTRSLKFEGTTSNYASSAAVGVLGDQGRCIGMWFKRSTSGDEASEQELLSYGNSGTAGEEFSVVINTSSNIQVNIGSTSNIRGTIRINDTDWHHLTILQLSPESSYYSDDRAIKILVDTISCVDTSSYTQTSINTRITGASDLLTIGKGFKGYINEVKMFNYSLSKPEIDALYANKNQYMLNLE